MKKLPLFMTALSVLVSTVAFTGCGKTVKPGDVQGYDEGEQYLSMWVHTIEDLYPVVHHVRQNRSFHLCQADRLLPEDLVHPVDL